MLRVVAVMLALALVACSGATHSSSPSTTSTTTTVPVASGASPPAFTPRPIDWHSCGNGLRCARVTVPRDYADPTGPTVELAVSEHPARKPDERVGVLFFNPGGPGAPAHDFVASDSFPSGVIDRFDIVAFDPRGVPDSTAVDCGANTESTFRAVDSAPDSPGEQAQLDAAAKQVADNCAQHSGDLLPFIGTDMVARDMDTIRRALGEQQLNYLGVSYGTLLGLRYLSLFPHNARAVVLDGVVDPTQDLTASLRDQTIGFDQQLTRELDDAGLAATYDDVARTVETHPLPAAGGPVGPSELALAAIESLYQDRYHADFARAIAAARAGDGGLLRQLADRYVAGGTFGAYEGVVCTDSPHPPDLDAYHAFAAELERLSPRLGGAVANELLPCVFWPVPVHDTTGVVAAPDGPPTLVVGNTDDPVTPYAAAQRVAATLAHGRLLTVASDSHAAFGSSDCVDGIESTYFTDLTLPAEGSRC